MIELSYSEARAKFASLWDRIIDDRDMAIIHRRGKEDVVMMAADEVRSLVETMHLLTPPANARRIFDALARMDAGEGVEMSVEEIRDQFFGKTD